jgi:hypothetical protein
MKISSNSYLKLIVLQLALIMMIITSSCTSTQISSAMKSASDYLDEDQQLTTTDVVAGLKEALVKGAQYSTASASKTDGYLKNVEIKIPFPPEIEKIETTLRGLGLNKPVDDFIMSINRAAEQAANEAKPLFVNAIMSMTIEDAWGILKGDNHAATAYLRKTTSAQLEVKFEPIISNALNKVNATKYYKDMSTQYNRIPFVTKVETDLPKYVNQKAIDGLFILVAKEEEKIRKDPLARTTELLKRVFSYEK